MSSSDQRGVQRRRTIFGGILLAPNKQAWDCRITDVSPMGVRLKTSFEVNAGEKVLLRISRFNGIHQCEVIWADGGFMGLRFLTPGAGNELNFSNVVNTVSSLEEMMTNKVARSA